MASRSGGAGMPAELCAPCVADWAADAPFLGCVGCSRCPRRGSCRLIPSPFRLVVGGAEVERPEPDSMSSGTPSLAEMGKMSR